MDEMKRTLKIEIECGEKTCASEPGKFCPYLGTVRMGTKYVCMLFPNEEGSHTLLMGEGGDEAGWLQRCPACLKAEELEEETC